MRLAIGAAFALAVAGTAMAETRRVPQDYANIQAAEDACVDGDTILVSKGRYILAATVTIDVPNVKVVGKGAIVDGTTTAGADIDAFYVNAAGVSITGFKFVNGSNAIVSDGGKPFASNDRPTESGVGVLKEMINVLMEQVRGLQFDRL